MQLASVLDPLYQLMAVILAAIYKIVPNYSLAIFGLTLTVLALLTPLTLKGLRSTIKIQKLMPEQKRLQAQFKDDRQALNEAMMALYKENKVSPVGGCLPLLVQSPFFFALFGVLRGMSKVHYYKLSNVQAGTPFTTWGKAVSSLPKGAKASDYLAVGAPQHLPSGSKLFDSLHGTKDLIEGSGLPRLGHSPGEVKSFGFDLARSASEMASKGFVRFLPYLVLIALMIGLQVVAQMQVNARNPQAAAANPQMQAVTKFMPFLFGIWGWAFPAGVTLYWTTSSALRIAQQWGLYRFDPTLAESVREKKAELARDVLDAKAKPSKGSPPAGGKGGANGKPVAKGQGGAPAQGKGGPLRPKPAVVGPKPAGAARPVARQQPKKRRKGR
jgi:YidC/Oxa1 family membrane protein insertase